MKKGCLINLVLVAVVLMLLGVLAFFVRIRPAADNVAVLKTAGSMTGKSPGDNVAGKTGCGCLAGRR